MNEKPTMNFDDDDDGWGTGWAFAVIWVVANTVGWNFSRLTSQVVLEASSTSLTQVGTGIGIGLTLGMVQWFILLTQPYRAGIWWPLATVVGWGVGWPLGWTVGWGQLSFMGFSVTYAAIGAIAGASTGAWQWLILQGQVRHAWLWIVANGIAWLIALYITRNVGTTVGGLIAGVITSAAIIWLFHHPVTATTTEA